MNAGRDVERLIAGWLVEEAEVRAPDRVLESARLTIDRTRQRRYPAAWRHVMALNRMTLGAAAAVLVVVVAGSAWIGRATAPGVGNPGASPTPAGSSSGPAVTIEAYRAARDEICNRHAAAVNPLKEQLDGLHDPETSAADRAAKAATLLDIVTQLEAMVVELDGLEPPAALAAGDAAYVTRYQDMTLLIRETLARVNEGDLVGAAAVDDAINVLNDPMLKFEGDNRLANCP